MKPEIVIVPEQGRYRLLFGHLHLTGILITTNEAVVDVKGEGKVKVIKTMQGLFVKRKDKQIPVLAH